MRSARSRRCSSSCSPVPTLLRTLNLSCRPPLGTRRGKLTASTPETLRAREEITRTFGRWIGMRCQARSAPRGEPHKRFASTQRAQVQRVKCSSYFGTSPQQHACISSDEVRDFRHCATCRKARAAPQSALPGHHDPPARLCVSRTDAAHVELPLHWREDIHQAGLRNASNTDTNESSASIRIPRVASASRQAAAGSAGWAALSVCHRRCVTKMTSAPLVAAGNPASSVVV